MILGPKFKEFNVELHGPKKSAYRKYPKQLDSNGRPDNYSCKVALIGLYENEIPIKHMSLPDSGSRNVRGR